MSALRTFRKSRRMSIEQLAKLLDSSIATISRIENGLQDPQPQMMRDIIRLSGGTISADDLLGLSAADGEAAPQRESDRGDAS